MTDMQVGAIDPNRPQPMSNDTASARPVRKHLDHSVHFHGRFGATYFITICCESRGMNQLCKEKIARLLFDTARRYDDGQRWYLLAHRVVGLTRIRRNIF